MNREILFRGKRVHNGEWVFGENIFHHSVSGLYYLAPLDTRYRITRHLDHSGDILFVAYDGEKKLYRIVPETLGQYTGLTDKNGTKIFEGDIVKVPSNDRDNYSIDFVPFVGMLVIHNHRDLGLDTDFTVWNGSDLEVIGNIHDNPELLEVKE